MSVSEKLKLLSFWQWRKVVREVVAVVKAAEEAKPYEREEELAACGVAFTAYMIPTDRIIRLDLALDALERKLP